MENHARVALGKRLGMESPCRVALLETPDGIPLFLAPVGTDMVQLY